MCLVLAAYNTHPGYKLILIANRDEFHDRPSRTLHNWNENPNIWGGQDLEGGGTWLGASVSGRIATLTNVRKTGVVPTVLRSRGLLIKDFLESTSSLDDFNLALANSAEQYAGYNMLIFDNFNLSCFNNTTRKIDRLANGIYTLSNADVHTAWPKTERIRRKFASAYKSTNRHFSDNLFEILQDRQKAPDKDLPNTGVGKKMEKELSPIFIVGEHYGTRCSSIITITNKNLLSFHEQSYDIHGDITDKRTFGFALHY